MQQGARTSRRIGMNSLAAALVAAIAVLLCAAGVASAKQFQPYGYDSSFDGSDSTPGAMSSGLGDLAIDNSTGNVYVTDENFSHVYVEKFNAAGEAQPFSALGKTAIGIDLENWWVDDPGSLYFDNTGHGLGIFLEMKAVRLSNFATDGTLKWTDPEENWFDIAVGPGGYVYRSGYGLQKLTSTGSHIENGLLYESGALRIDLDSEGHFYYTTSDGLYKSVRESECVNFESFAKRCAVEFRFANAPVTNFALDTATGHVFALEEGKRVTEYTSDGRKLGTFGLAEGPFGGLAKAEGIGVNATTHDVYVTNLKGTPSVAVFHQAPAVTVPDVETEPAGHPDETSGILNGTLNPDGVETTDCRFEWGQTVAYAGVPIPCDQGEAFSGSSDVAVSTTLEGLSPGATYHYRLASRNANGVWSYGVDRSFEASVIPSSPAVIVDRVNTDGARFTADVDPHGGTTKYHFEVGTEDCASNPCTAVPAEDATLEQNLDPQQVQQTISGLQPDTLYHVRLVVENGAGTYSVETTFRTQPSPPSSDACENARLRQETSAYLLKDCRAYELVSAPNARGYDVESDLVPGQEPFAAYPWASDRLLYGYHFGSLTGMETTPTNYGLDPYVAERGPDGWTTRYAGIPADEMADKQPFGSPLLGADDSLETLAFGGTGICNPCFEDGGTNIPVRYQGGAPIPGMPGEADPAGTVARYVSPDGSHLVFGSTTKLAEGGVEGALTLYERELPSGPTETVSTDENGSTLSGPDVAALAVSTDGSRVVVGANPSIDAHYHLYMHIAGSAESVDLTPGAATGAIFGGMTADGSKVFFSTRDQLDAADQDQSADVYEVEVDGAGSASSPQLISLDSNGAASNDDSCGAVGTPTNWNATYGSGEGRCDAVVLAGGAGLALGDGTFYFVSPEQLEAGEGEAGEVNLYVVRPGAAPEFVATIDSSATKEPPPPPQHPLVDEEFASVPSPEAITIDQSNGDFYVVRGTEGKVTRLDSAGNAKNFSAGPGSGTNTIGGFTFDNPSGASVAVDNAPGSPFEGDFYVVAAGGPYTGVTIWSPNGEKLGKLTGSPTYSSTFEHPCGVTVDPSDGTLYVGDRSGYIWKYVPTGSAPVDDSDYTVYGARTLGMSPCALAADGDGHVYGSQFSDGPVRRYLTARFGAAIPSEQPGQLVDAASKAIAVDPVTHDLYVDEGSQISIFNEGGKKVGAISGAGVFSGSRGVALNADTEHVYVSAAALGTIIEYGSTPTPYEPIDHAAVLDAVNAPLVHHYGDFQVSRNGDFAIFDTSQPLGSYANLGHSEIYRYDAPQGDLECASCNPTFAAAKADTFLSPYGLNLSEDGRVFFTSEEGLVLADTNEKSDAYEWLGGHEVGSISSGHSLSDSKLLSVSADGRDAFFFTRDVLVPTDRNGSAVKVYDAREGGGFPRELERKPCAASDECHGPGTPTPAAPDINSLEGAELPGPAAPPAKRCKKGSVKKHGKCVKKPKKRHHHRKASHRHG